MGMSMMTGGDAPTLNLDRIWATLQPNYDGNALAEALDVPKGPLIGGLMAAQREWQLAQPAGDKDTCLAYLRSRVEDLRQTHGLTSGALWEPYVFHAGETSHVWDDGQTSRKESRAAAAKKRKGRHDAR